MYNRSGAPKLLWTLLARPRGGTRRLGIPVHIRLYLKMFQFSITQFAYFICRVHSER